MSISWCIADSGFVLFYLFPSPFSMLQHRGAFYPSLGNMNLYSILFRKRMIFVFRLWLIVEIKHFWSINLVILSTTSENMLRLLQTHIQSIIVFWRTRPGAARLSLFRYEQSCSSWLHYKWILLMILISLLIQHTGIQLRSDPWLYQLANDCRVALDWRTLQASPSKLTNRLVMNNSNQSNIVSKYQLSMYITYPSPDQFDDLFFSVLPAWVPVLRVRKTDGHARNSRRVIHMQRDSAPR